MVLWLLAIPALLLVAAGGNRSFRGEVSLPSSGREMVTSPFQLKQGWLGAPRIALKVRQPINTSSLVNVELLNDQNQVVLSFYKDTWRDAGTWYEGGESGRWDEQDTDLTTEFRPGQTGQFRLRLSLEDFIASSSSATPQTSPAGRTLPVLVEIYTNTLDAGLLVGTFVVLLMGSGIFCWYEYAPKRVLRSFTRTETSLALAESFPDQATLKVSFGARYEQPDHPVQTLPATRSSFFCRVSLSITDAWGATLWARPETVQLNAFQIGEDDRGFRGEQAVYFRLKSAKRLRIRVEVPEDLEGRVIELERLQLTVTELTKTMSTKSLEELA
ncbi:MAG: hypothetical protein ACPHGV_04955 [Synechococcus sp.]